MSNSNLVCGAGPHHRPKHGDGGSTARDGTTEMLGVLLRFEPAKNLHFIRRALPPIIRHGNGKSPRT